jgi:hypothetical protein
MERLVDEPLQEAPTLGQSENRHSDPEPDSRDIAQVLAKTGNRGPVARNSGRQDGYWIHVFTPRHGEAA